MSERPEPNPLFAHRYHMTRRLGRGGMGDVWLAEQTGLRGFRRRTVIKRIHTHLADDHRFVERFEDEARLAALLQHPNIVRVEDFGEFHGVLYLAMEYVEGCDLKSLTQHAEGARSGLPVQLLIHIVAQTARALHYAHHITDFDGVPLQLVHRDVTPHNIMVTSDGQVRLLDFGVAKSQVQRRETVAGTIQGKLGYLSPEQLRRGPIDGRSDLFSLATLAWELCTRRRLFSGGSQADVLRQIHAAHVPDVPFKSDCPATLRRLIHQSLARNPNDRPASLGALADALDEIARTVDGYPSSGQAARWIADLLTAPRVPLRKASDFIAESTEHQATLLVESADIEQMISDDGAVVTEHVPLPMTAEELTLPTPANTTNLPKHPTKFVGRQDLLESLRQLVLDEQPLISILGPGGAGKSRFAVQFAMEHLDEYPGGVWFVDLTTVETLEGIVSATRSALGVTALESDDGQPMERLAYSMASRGKTLFILDNFEHLTELAAECFGTWLRLASQAQFLVTSQKRLNLRAERVFELSPLGAEAAQELFCSGAARLGVKLEQSDLLARIVERLDGLPLAIELAAANAPTLSLRQILERLDQRFELLRSRKVDVTDRQRTLYQTIEWSWSLLTDYERDTMEQCSIFRGGFFMEDAERIVDLSSYRNAPTVWEVLAGLRDRSLLKTVMLPRIANQLRFAFYESIHEFASARRSQRADAQILAERYAGCMVERSEKRLETIKTRAVSGSLRVLAIELDNLRQITESGSPGLRVRAAVIIARVLAFRGPYDQLSLYAQIVVKEGRQVGLPDAVCDALHALCAANIQRGRYEEASQQAIEGLALADTMVTPYQLGRFHRLIGEISMRTGRDAVAQDNLLKALDIARANDFRVSELGALHALAQLETFQARLESGERYANRYVHLARHYDAPLMLPKALASMSWVLSRQGRFAEAEQSYKDALTMSEDIEDYYLASATAINLADLMLNQKRYEEAEQVLSKAKRYSDQLGSMTLAGFAGINLAVLAIRQGRRTHAKDILSGLAMGTHPRLSSWICSLYGVLLGLDGQVNEAQAMIKDAVEFSHRAGDPVAILLAELCGCGAILYQAEQALVSGEEIALQAHIVQLDAQVAKMHEPLLGEEHEPRSAVEHDTDIEVVLDLITPRLDALHKQIDNA